MKPSAFVQDFRSVVKLVAVMAILIVLYMVASRLDVQWDMTVENIYSLSEKSLETADGIKTPVTLYLFHTTQAGQSRFDTVRLRNLLRRYASVGENITFREVDHTRNPGLARKHGIRQNNVVLIKTEGQTTKLSQYDLMKFGGPRGRRRQFQGESALTTALIKVTRATDRVVHFTTGFGEYTSESAKSRSVSEWAQSLREQGYETKSFNPFTDTLPDSRDMIVILDPKKKYPPDVVKQFRQWNRKGGNLLVASSPASGRTLNPILQGTAISFRSLRIIDPNRRVQSLQSLVNPYIFAPELGSHPSLSNLKEQGFAVQNGLSTAIAVSDTKQVDRLLMTSSAAYGKPLDVEGNNSTEFNASTDVNGPFTVGTFVNSEDRGKLFAFGTASLFGNRMLGRTPGNKTFSVNLVNWTFDRDVSLEIPATPANYNQVTVTAVQSYVIQTVALLIIPVGIVTWGGLVWWNRRNR